MASPTTTDGRFTIGQIADRAGLNTSHIRFYERIGVLPEPERVAGRRRYRGEVLHRLSIIDVAQRAGLTLEEIAPLTGPGNRSADASRHIRELADEKLPHIDALIARAQAVNHWLRAAQSCDCASVDVNTTSRCTLRRTSLPRLKETPRPMCLPIKTDQSGSSRCPGCPAPPLRAANA